MLRIQRRDDIDSQKTSLLFSIGARHVFHHATAPYPLRVSLLAAIGDGQQPARTIFRIPLAGYIPRSRFDSLAKIARVRAPVLIIHGTRDEVIPFSMGQRLYQAAPEPKWFLPIEGAGHDAIFLIGGEPYLDRLKEFMGMGSGASPAGMDLLREQEHEVR